MRSIGQYFYSAKPQIGNRRGERERTVGTDAQIVTSVVLQYQSGAGQARDVTADREGVGRAAHQHVGDVGAGQAARTAADRAGLRLFPPASCSERPAT